MPKSYTKRNRGAHRRENCVFVGVWIPSSWVTDLDDLVKDQDSDRSKVIRKAVQEKITKPEEVIA